MAPIFKHVVDTMNESKRVKLLSNKRSKGPHNVHLSTMCHLFEVLARVALFCLPIGPKNTNLVGEVGILLPVRFPWIPFCGLRWEVEHVLANQRRCVHLVFSIGPKIWLRTLRSGVQLSFVEFLSAVSEEKSNISQPIRGQGDHLVVPIGQLNTNLVEDIVKFRCFPFSGFGQGYVK